MSRTTLLFKPFSSSASSSRHLLFRRPLSAMSAPRFSPGTDAAAVEPRLNALLAPAGRWTLTADGQAIERSFRFKTFAKTWDFMTAVSLQCKIKSHHPEWSNVYNTAIVRWTTHNPRGLSEKDIVMAAACDTIARDFAELEPKSEADSGKLADECCTKEGSAK